MQLSVTQPSEADRYLTQLSSPELPLGTLVCLTQATSWGRPGDGPYAVQSLHRAAGQLMVDLLVNGTYRSAPVASVERPTRTGSKPMKKATKRGPGRPSLGGPQPHRVFRASDKDWTTIKRAAKREGLTASEWIRRTLLEAAKRNKTSR